MLPLKQRINAIVEHAEPNLPIIGLFGTFGYPLFYIVWKYLIPQPYENLKLRLAEAVISLPWLLYRHLPKKAKDLFPLYFVFSVPVLIPFFFHYMLLKNDWSVTWAMSSMACLFLLILIVNDWVFICFYTFVGFVMAYIVVYATDGYVSYAYFRLEYIPAYLFALVGGLLANYRRQAAHQTKISLMRSLSGSIAHEMRNPLSSITHAMSTVQSIIPDKPLTNDEQQKFDISYASLIGIHDVIDEGLATIKRGNKIIDSILATLHDGLMDTSSFKKLSVKSTIDAALASYGYDNSGDRKLIVENTADTFDFLGDKDLFIYVLFNLIKNALYYKSKPGFSIEITTQTGITANYVRIRDTGPGVPSGKREVIFDRFYTFGKSGGNGLGLSFCRRVINSFGGSISCDSEEGHWTEFIIRLPAYNTSKIANDIKREILKNKRILIVDDQVSNRLLLTKFISEWDFTIDQAENGKQALELVAKASYDLIFMDFEMPVLPGDVAVNLMRQSLDIDPALARCCTTVPIVGITALPEADALPRAAACGMNEVLIKPLKKKEIGKVLERYFFSETPSISNDHKEVLSNSRILVVDDNETNRKFMSMILEHYGCSIGQAENGQQAIMQLEQQDYDLILMDMEMPVMNGVEATRAIRKGAGFRRFMNYSEIPIIALTGNTDQKSVIEVQTAGMNHFLSKPIFRDELVSTLASWLKRGAGKNDQVVAERAVHSDGKINGDNWSAIQNEAVLDHSIIGSLKSVGDNELLQSLFEVFVKDAENLIEELTKASSAGNVGHFEKISHTLKGSAASMGANRLFVLASHLNDRSRRGEWPEHDSWNRVIKATYVQTVQEMGGLIKSDTHPASSQEKRS